MIGGYSKHIPEYMVKTLNYIKSEQIGVVHFVKVTYSVYTEAFVKTRRDNDSRKFNITSYYKYSGTDSANGLQIGNRVYLRGENVKIISYDPGAFRLLNSGDIEITKIYSGIPKWAPKDLIGMYYNALNMGAQCEEENRA